MNRHASKTASVARLASIPRTKKFDMMSISPPAYTGYIALLEPLTHHCDIVETETKVGPSKIAPAAVHLGAAVGRNRLSGRDLDQIVAQLMWFCAAVAAHSTVPHATSTRNWH